MLLISSDKSLYDRLDLTNAQIVFLSEYCLKDKKLISSLKNRISSDSWEDSDIKKRDLKYLQIQYEVLIELFSKKLNLIHNCSEDKKYWEIIIGFWLHEFLGLTFIYYNKVKNCLEKYDIKSHLGQKIKNYNCTPINISHYYTLNTSEVYNYNLSLRIINFLNPKIKLINTNFNLDQFKDNYLINKNNINSLIIKFSGKVLLFINRLIKQKIFFDESYLNFLQKIKLALYFGGLPTPNINNYIPKTISVNPNIRGQLSFSDRSSNDKFINFFLSIVKDYMPMSYLENFKEINGYYCQRGSDCKYILSANSFTTNDNFKIWAAERIKNGAKYILSDHGDSFKKKYYSPDNVIKNISDLTLQFNSKEKKKNFFFNPGLLTKKKTPINKKNITIISLDNSWRPRRAASDLQSFSIYKSVDQIVDLCKSMDLYNIENYIIKSYKNRGINTSKLYKSHFDNKVSNKSLEELYLSSSLIICTYPSTTLIESLSRNIPTILLYPENCYYLEDNFNELIEKMKSEGLIYNCSKKCFNFLKEKNNNFDTWWNNEISNDLKFSLEKTFLKGNDIKNLANKILKL